MSSLEFAFQSSVEETAIGCLRDLNILLSRSQFAYDPGALGATHGVFSPPLNLEILPRMGVVRIEHGDTSTMGRVYEFTAARNHRDSPIALDLTIDKVVQHVHDKDGVPSVVVVHVRCNCGVEIVDVDLFRWALSMNSSHEPSWHAGPRRHDFKMISNRPQPPRRHKIGRKGRRCDSWRRNGRLSLGIRTAEEKHLDPSIRSQERARLDSPRHNLPAQWPGSAGQDRSSGQRSADGLGRENTRGARLEPTGPVRSRLRTA